MAVTPDCQNPMKMIWHDRTILGPYILPYKSNPAPLLQQDLSCRCQDCHPIPDMTEDVPA